MKNSRNEVIVYLLLKNSIIRFIAGILSIFIILKIGNAIEYKLLQIIVKSFGYGFFCYLTTPFMIYWLSYASQATTSKKIAITIALTSLYSYLIWDAYFFFRDAIASLFAIAG